MLELIQKLENTRSLTLSEYKALANGYTPSLAAQLAEKADRIRRSVYGDQVFIRGLIEISNYCRNDCLYCGIRRSNERCDRYRLSREQILSSCRIGYPLGFRTFVLQGGEDAFFTDEYMADTVSAIKSEFPDCAVTLSLGERSRESYRRLFDAGADRYLLRHETADPTHYGRLHPPYQSFENRMRCLNDLREIGYQVGCGFMVGSPYQTADTIAEDLKFIETFKPDMCGIGPFIPHKDTPFAAFAPGTAEYTCYLLSIVRLICPTVLLPATTALGTICPGGREMGLRAGANVVMPNLSPANVREKYMLYDNKLSGGDEAAEELSKLKEKIKSAGYRCVTDRGDIRKDF